MVTKTNATTAILFNVATVMIRNSVFNLIMAHQKQLGKMVQ